MAKVLIIEDDDTVQTAYAMVLQKEGFEVDLASDGLQGLKKASEYEPDIILLDMLMPNLSGMDFLKAYNPKDHPSTKVLVFTNLEGDKTIEQAMTLGARTFMVKARYTPKEVVDTIKRELVAG
jgi:DNA-binding response OmpR family regulator